MTEATEDLKGVLLVEEGETTKIRSILESRQEQTLIKLPNI